MTDTSGQCARRCERRRDGFTLIELMVVVTIVGVLAAVAAVFAEHDVSIETVRQRAESPDDAELVIVTHQAADDALAATVDGLTRLDTVRAVLSVMRVEGE